VESKLIKSILAGDIDLESLTEEELNNAQETMKLMKSMVNSQDSNVNEEIVKIDDNGQWSMHKAIKPGDTINYNKMNKPEAPKEGPDAHTIDYSGKEPKVTGEPWKTSDTKKVILKPNREDKKEAIIRREVKRGNVIDNREEKTKEPAKEETAMETIERRKKENK